MIDLFLNLLIAQGLLGAFDTLYHHEFKVGLAQKVTARTELAIHSMRAMLYGVLFAGLAFFEWHGGWVWVLSAIVLVEVGLTLWDFVVEDQTRLLPGSERITHTILAINGGAAFVLLAMTLPEWYAKPGQLYFIDYGWRSWFLLLAGVGVFLSGLRDGYAAWQVQRLDLKLNLDLGGAHKKLLISGGTGFIGSALCSELLHAGHNITLITRQPIAAAIQFAGKIRAVKSTAELSDDEHFDIVVNLAGAPVVGPRWSKARKTLLLASRLNTTRDLLSFVKRTSQRPAVWVQASAIGFYGAHTDHPVNETEPSGSGFAAEMCVQWEKLTNELELLGVRRVILRFGLVFGRSGGSLPMMLLSFRLGLGAILGNGKQHMGWIHIEDLLQLIARVIADDSIHGKINAVTPDSPTYQQFAKLAGKQLHRPVFLYLPAKLIRLLLGEMASLFVDGPVILPTRLLKMKFRYRFPNLRSAMMDLT